MQDFQCNEIIIGGDFNLVMDIEKIREGGAPARIKTPSKRLKEFAKKKKDTLGEGRNRIFNVGSISF